MRGWSLGVLILGILGIIIFFSFTKEVRNTTSVVSEFSSSVLVTYIVNLELQREECYGDILMLGTLNEEQLERLDFNLKTYLEELISIDNIVRMDREVDWRLIYSIELDMKLIEKVIRAIETKDAYYLRDVNQIYQQLINFQQVLKREIEEIYQAR